MRCTAISVPILINRIAQCKYTLSSFPEWLLPRVEATEVSVTNFYKSDYFDCANILTSESH